MVLTKSSPAQIWFVAPDFSLWNPTTQTWQKLEQLRGREVTVILFICNHCPYVKAIKSALTGVAKRLSNERVKFIGINSNDPEHLPQDKPELMVLQYYPFPYLYDETQEVAKKYGAVCTPDIFVFDEQPRLTYRGQFDSSRPGKGTPDGHNLISAISRTLRHEPIEVQMASTGCNIKWREKEIKQTDWAHTDDLWSIYKYDDQE